MDSSLINGLLVPDRGKRLTPLLFLVNNSFNLQNKTINLILLNYCNFIEFENIITFQIIYYFLNKDNRFSGIIAFPNWELGGRL